MNFSVTKRSRHDGYIEVNDRPQTAKWMDVLDVSVSKSVMMNWWLTAVIKNHYILESSLKPDGSIEILTSIL